MLVTGLRGAAAALASDQLLASRSAAPTQMAWKVCGSIT
jgi:hypothetical protein